MALTLENDFPRSFADENVSFTTVLATRESELGANYQTAMLFIEKTRYCDTTTWSPIGSTGAYGVAVDVTTYADYVSGKALSWLYDYFATGTNQEAIIVALPFDVGDSESSADTEANIAALTAVFNVMKPYGYFKTILVGVDVTAANAPYYVEFAKLCSADTLFSSVALFPLTAADPTSAAVSDPLYSALVAAGANAYMVWHTDTTRNGALYLVGSALSEINQTGLSVANGFEYAKSNAITASNGGENPTAPQKKALKAMNVAWFKTVGDNTGNVAAEGETAIRGTKLDVVPANWMVAYITYMSKVQIAQLITTRNFFRNEENYEKIVNVVRTNVNRFRNAGRIEDVAVVPQPWSVVKPILNRTGGTANLGKAWYGTWVGIIKKVHVTGELTIGD